jgi:hypothetical protein
MLQAGVTRCHRGPIISDLDIWRTANPLIRKHGADAELETARLQDLMLHRGDDEGRSCGRGSGGPSRRHRQDSKTNRTEPVAALIADRCVGGGASLYVGLSVGRMAGGHRAVFFAAATGAPKEYAVARLDRQASWL